MLRLQDVRTSTASIVRGDDTKGALEGVNKRYEDNDEDGTSRVVLFVCSMRANKDARLGQRRG